MRHIVEYIVCIILSLDLNIELEITTTCCSNKMLASILQSHKFAPNFNIHENI